MLKKCTVCKRDFPEEELITGHGIRHEIEGMIRNAHAEWSDAGVICPEDYQKFRSTYISNLLEEEIGGVKDLEKEVFDSIRENALITENANKAVKEELKIGDRISDKVAQFGGSWRFIIIFFIILLGWIIINSAALFGKPFDPFPFILMNLILSCIAAIQAPIIMMSQNRQETKDRVRQENDYKINLKAEIEIRTLHEKVDHLLLDQWSKMMRVQEFQLEMLEELRKK